MANDITNKQVKGQPFDENGRSLAGLALPILDGFGKITGWAPVSTVAQPDGSLMMRVEANLTITDPNIDIGDVHLLDLTNTRINPSTAENQAAIGTRLDGLLKVGSTTGVAADVFLPIDPITGRLLVDVFPGAGSTAQTVDIIAGDGSGFKAVVDSSGRLLVSQVTTAPPETTAVEVEVLSNMSGVLDTVYIVTSGTVLTVQQLRGGCESSQAGSKVELFIDEDGTGATLTFKDVIFANGSSNNNDLSFSIIGNGSRAIRMRRTAFGGGSREVFGAWRGFEGSP